MDIAACKGRNVDLGVFLIGATPVPLQRYST